MGNVWGIANPWALPVLYFAGSDVPCPAGSETTVLSTGPISTPGPGNFYPIIWATLVVLMGATPCSTLTAAFKLGAGSDVAVAGVNLGLLVANATIAIPLVMLGTNSGTAWAGAGSTINITLNPTAQAITWRAGGSYAIVALFRGPDG